MWKVNKRVTRDLIPERGKEAIKPSDPIACVFRKITETGTAIMRSHFNLF